MISAFDRVLGFAWIVASSIGENASAVLVNLRAQAASPNADDAEIEAGTELYGTVGIVGRPRADDGTGSAEAIIARSTDQLIPIAARDLRINAARGAVAEGTFSLATYTGAHVSVLDEQTGTTKGSVILSQPAASGTHQIKLDGATGAEKITITHTTGAKIEIDETGKITISTASGAAVLTLDDAGGVQAGSGSAAVALAGPLQTWAAAVTTATGVPALSGTVASTKIKG